MFVVNLFSFDFIWQMHPGVPPFCLSVLENFLIASASQLTHFSPRLVLTCHLKNMIFGKKAACVIERGDSTFTVAAVLQALMTAFHWKASITDDVNVRATWREAGFNTDSLRSFSKGEGCWGVWWCLLIIYQCWHGSMTLNWTTDLPLSISATKH